MAARYVELAIGDPKYRGYIHPLGEVSAQGTKARAENRELYRSMYTFDEALVEHFKRYKSVKSFQGPAWLDQLIFDIDKGTNVDQIPLDRARAFVDMLREDLVDSDDMVHAFYSGRGYHICIPDVYGFTPGVSLPDEVKATLTKHFEGIDPLIYDKTRLIRVVNTVNKKSGKFKIALTLQELFSLTVDEVKTLAASPRAYKHPPYPKVDKLAGDKIVRHQVKLAPGKNLAQERPAADYSNVVTCCQKLFAEGGQEGGRHRWAPMLIANWQQAGIPKEGVRALIKLWAPTWDDVDLDKMFDPCWTKGYVFNCENEQMKQYCDARCIWFKKKNYNIQIADAKSMEAKFVQFVRTNFSDTSFDLSTMYDIPSYKFYPGELAMIIGDTKLGKTAFVQNIVCKLPKMKTLYLSLEVSQNLIYRRFVQIAHGMTKDEVLAHYSKNDNALSTAIDHIQCITISPDLDEMRKTIASVMPRIVVVDTVDGISVEDKRNDKIEQIAIGLKEIAQQLNVIIIGVHHISKHSILDPMGKTKALTVHAGKGSSAIEQKADKIIGIEGNQVTSDRLITSLGARDEAGFRMMCNMNPATFIFRQLQLPEPKAVPLKPQGLSWITP